jgi:hypothetical protein
MKNIEAKSVIFANYTELLVPRFFKILPLFEEKNEGLFSYIQSLIFELNGLYWTIESLQKEGNFLLLLATLESISDEVLMYDEESQVIIRREVFRCIDVIKQLKSTSESGE